MNLAPRTGDDITSSLGRFYEPNHAAESEVLQLAASERIGEIDGDLL